MNESFDLSEVSNIVNNDSDGHLLAQYLKKKSGKVVTRRIFGEENEIPMNIEVCLRKLENREKENVRDNQKNDENPKKSVAETAASNNLSFSRVQTDNQNTGSPFRLSGRSPLPSYLRRTPHTTDKLRQSTLKRLTQQLTRRSLVREFNITESSAVDIFSPRVASTPLCSVTPQKQNELNNAEGTSNKVTTAQSTTPNSPRRYTIEKAKSGQILLTPLSSPIRSIGDDLNRLSSTERHEEHVPASAHIATKRSLTLGNVENATSKERIPATPTKSDNQNALVVRVMENSPRASNIEINCTEHQIILSSKPSTNTEHIPKKSRLTQQSIASPLRLSAVDRTLERTTNVENQVDALVTTSQSKNNNHSEPESEHIGAGTFTVQPSRVSSIIQHTENLSEIITDDEDSPSVLVENAEKDRISSSKRASRTSRTRKLRKRKSKSNTSFQTQTQTSNATNKFVTEKDTARTSVSRRNLPLNKAPRTPINGEKYADELKRHLAGLSNHKVLDLRRRKSSLTKNKPEISSANNPSVDSQNAKQTHEANRKSNKQHNPTQLDANQFENEVATNSGEDNEIDLCTPQLEREDPTNNEKDNQNECNNEVEIIEEIILQTPPTQSGSDRFRKEVFEENVDNNQNNFPNDEIQLSKKTPTPTPTQPQTASVEQEIFQNENSNDRVLFSEKAKKSVSNGKKNKGNKATSEIYESYINATQRISETNRKLNESKRSLYSVNERENSPLSPTSLSVAMIPPPLMFRSSTPRKRPLPSPEESPSSTTSSNVVLPNAETQIEKENDAVFKKPQGVPLKRKKVKTKPKNIEKEISEETNPDGEESTLRRSKRDRKQVPISLFWVMLENNLLKSMEKSKERKLNASKLLKSMSKVNNTDNDMIPIASSTANPVNSVAKKKSKKSASRNTNFLSEIPEEEQISAVQANEPTKSAKSKSSKPRKKKKLPEIPEDEQISTVQTDDIEHDENFAKDSTKSKSSNPRKKKKLPEIQEDEQISTVQTEDIVHDEIFAKDSTKSKSSKPRKKKKLPEIQEDEQISTVQTDDIAHDEIFPAQTDDNRKNNELSTILSDSETTTTNKNLRVRVKRLNITAATEQSRHTIQSEISSSTSPSRQVENNDQANFTAESSSSHSDFVTLLKNLNKDKTMIETNTQKSFRHMSLSTYDELTFTSFHDVDYAFYNTKQRNILGYMRFQPHQIKPSSRVKQNLTLLVISGEFNVTSEGETTHLKECSLISINAGYRYSIANLRNDISIVLFIKL